MHPVDAALEQSTGPLSPVRLTVRNRLSPEHVERIGRNTNWALSSDRHSPHAKSDQATIANPTVRRLPYTGATAHERMSRQSGQ